MKLYEIGKKHMRKKEYLTKYKVLNMNELNPRNKTLKNRNF